MSKLPMKLLNILKDAPKRQLSRQGQREHLPPAPAVADHLKQGAQKGLMPAAGFFRLRAPEHGRGNGNLPGPERIRIYFQPDLHALEAHARLPPGDSDMRMENRMPLVKKALTFQQGVHPLVPAD